MNETADFSASKVRTWQATMELRWEQRSSGHMHFGGQYVPPFTVLQQRWVCREDGASNWRDIPTIMAATSP